MKTDNLITELIIVALLLAVALTIGASLVEKVKTVAPQEKVSKVKVTL